MGIYNGLLSWQPVAAQRTYALQPETRFTLPNSAGPGPESSISPDGGTGPYTTYYGPTWRAEVDQIITAVRIEVTGALASNTCRLGLAEVGSDDQPSELVADFGTVDCSATGFKDVTGVQVRIYASRYYQSLFTRFGGGGSISLRAWPVPYGHFGQDQSVTNRVMVRRKSTNSQTSPTAGYPQRPLPWSTVESSVNSIGGPHEWMLIRRESVSR